MTQIEKTPQEQATATLKSAMDSVNVVNQMVSSTNYTSANASKEVLGNIDRNYHHLEIVLARDFVIADTTDKTPYQTAVTTGKEYITTAISANNANAEGIIVA